MIALLHYALLKSSRERFLYALIFSPAIMILAPLLGVTGYHAFRRETIFPVTFDLRQSALSTSREMTIVSVVLCSLAAAGGGFWIFRREAANRSLGFLALAVRPQAIAVAATIYGALAGAVSFLVMLLCTVALTTAVPLDVVPLFTAAVLACAVSSALGVTLMAWSSDTTMLFPVYGGALAVVVTILNGRNTLIWAAAIAATLMLTLAASRLMRRQCAI